MKKFLAISCALATTLACTMAGIPAFAASTDTDWTYFERMFIKSSVRPPHTLPAPYRQDHSEQSIIMPAHWLLDFLNKNKSLVTIVIFDAFSKFRRDSRSDRHGLIAPSVPLKPEMLDGPWIDALYSLESTSVSLEKLLKLKNCAPKKSAERLSCGINVKPSWLDYPWDFGITNAEPKHARMKKLKEAKVELIKSVEKIAEEIVEEMFEPLKQILDVFEKNLKTIQDDDLLTPQNKTEISKVNFIQADEPADLGAKKNPATLENASIAVDGFLKNAQTQSKTPQIPHKNETLQGRNREILQARSPEETPVIHSIMNPVPTPQPSLKVRTDQVQNDYWYSPAHFGNDCIPSINANIIVCPPLLLARDGK